MRKPKILTKQQQVRIGPREKVVLDYLKDIGIGENVSDRVRYCVRETGKKIGATA